MRQLIRLVQWLPMDSPLHRARDPEGIGSGWSMTNHLLALLAELSDTGNTLYLRKNARRGTRVPPPLVIPRPGREEADRTRVLRGRSAVTALRMHGVRVVRGPKHG